MKERKFSEANLVFVLSNPMTIQFIEIVIGLLDFFEIAFRYIIYNVVNEEVIIIDSNEIYFSIVIIFFTFRA
jgi:hypothetical protein